VLDSVLLNPNLETKKKSFINEIIVQYTKNEIDRVSFVKCVSYKYSSILRK
jgi:UDP-N-acetylglucosamine transferase subunit ALG13